MKKKVSLASVLLFVFIAAMVTVGCSDVFLKGGDNFSVSFVTPGNSSSRNATGADWSIRAWLELEDGTKLQNKTTTASAGQSVSIVFDSVPAGISLQVKVELAKGTSIKYAGRSKTVVVKAGNNELSLALQQVVSDWTSLREVLYSGGTGNIYLYGDFIANETISGINGSPNLIAYGPVTFTREDGFTGALIQNSTPWTISGSPSSPIAFDGKNESVGNPMISAEADLTMTYCTMQNNVNTASSGGAIYVTDGTLTLENCTFIGNKTTYNLGQGGAVCIEGQTTKSQITSSSFTNNTATYGGGAIIINGDVSEGTDYIHTLSDCTFNGNSISGGNGGGIYIYKGLVTINGITMTDNTNSDNKNQDIFLYYASTLTLGDTVSIPSLYNNFSSEYPTMRVSQSFNSASSVGIVLSPASGTTYPTTCQLFTLEDGASVFSWVDNFTISGEDGSQYTISDYGTIQKQ